MSANEIKPLVYTAHDLAEILRLSERTIRRMDASGTLPKAVRFGRSKRWRVSDIQAWLEQGGAK